MPRLDLSRLVLPAQHLKTLQALLAHHVPDAEVWAYGSRVTGAGHDGSDLDLVLRNPADPCAAIEGWLDLQDALRDSTLPMLVDVHLWSHLPEDFRRNIEDGYVVLQGADEGEGFRKIIERDRVALDFGGPTSPKNWHQVALADLINIKHGFAFQGEFFSTKGPGDLLVTPGNFAIGGGFQQSKPKYYSGPVSDDYVLKAGDLIVTMTDLSKAADTLGYAAIVPNSKERLLHNQRIGKIIRRSNSVDLYFLHWLMRSEHYRNEVLASVTGSTVKHTSPTKILAFKFSLPPLEEQKSIASILGALDDKIELNRRMNETLEAIARAIFKDWFVDFGPTRAKMEGRAPYLAPDIWSLFPDRLDDEGKPEGWVISTIGEEVDVFGGSTPSTKEPGFWGGKIAWATPKDLSSLNTPVLLETERRITQVGLSQIGTGLLPIGTVLLSSRAPIGYLAVAQIPTAINQGFIAMVCRKRISNIFVWLWVQANMETILQNANGSTFQEISKANFRPIAVAIASQNILREFDKMVRPFFERIVTNEKESRTLAQTRDLLLPKLMSGEIRVRDAEKAATILT